MKDQHEQQIVLLAIELWNEREIKQRNPQPWNEAHPMARFIVYCRILKLMDEYGNAL